MLFADGIWDENYVENMDKAHLVFNLDNHYTLDTRVAHSVNYADVVCRAGGFTMILHLRGGTNERLEALFIIFKKKRWQLSYDEFA